MASTSTRSVTFAEEKEEILIEGCESESSDESDIPDYVESLSEGEIWSSSDEEHAELFEHVLEGAYVGPSPLSSESRLEPAERGSLLLLDKDLLRHEDREGEILNAQVQASSGSVSVLLTYLTHSHSLICSSIHALMNHAQSLKTVVCIPKSVHHAQVSIR